MIKDKKLGLKIAVNETETLWENVRLSTTERIKNAKNSLIIEEAFLKLAEEKLKEFDK